ncbi:hypothetical protein M9H77_14897 [Catharanthus roseus]|uniref:Uncharacterized protein n=1 Tax=Catharanthus roseus TaxID=4058 RepID=A0ACC0BPN2_CATRO|nr:hypothetical protein M9H77_14897 [Catharanthus roseus]
MTNIISTLIQYIQEECNIEFIIWRIPRLPLSLLKQARGNQSFRQGRSRDEMHVIWYDEQELQKSEHEFGFSHRKNAYDVGLGAGGGGEVASKPSPELLFSGNLTELTGGQPNRMGSRKGRFRFNAAHFIYL